MIRIFGTNTNSVCQLSGSEGFVIASGSGPTVYKAADAMWAFLNEKIGQGPDAFATPTAFEDAIIARRQKEEQEVRRVWAESLTPRVMREIQETGKHPGLKLEPEELKQAAELVEKMLGNLGK